MNHKIHAQNKECLNQVITKYLSKNIKYSTSTELILSLAILTWNKDNWIVMIYEKLYLELFYSPYCECWKGRQMTKRKKNPR